MSKANLVLVITATEAIEATALEILKGQKMTLSWMKWLLKLRCNKLVARNLIPLMKD